MSIRLIIGCIVVAISVGLTIWFSIDLILMLCGKKWVDKGDISFQLFVTTIGAGISIIGILGIVNAIVNHY